ncbi:MAG: dTDP-4-dehydrorhamnose reductase [Myxococcota bacterium]|nr:dTDP-4-dehydrorhamnose reductase [Myxococcota bacterium]
MVITGGSGMLGRTIRSRMDTVAWLAPDSAELDIRDRDATLRLFDREKPTVVVHCAAATQVDRCESEREWAFAVNEKGSENVARAAHAVGARLIAFSTDYVFSGDGHEPQVEAAPTVPKTIYGMSKLAGEQAIAREAPNHLIARISWLYGPGGPSFVHTMMRLGAEGGDPLKVVHDQVGGPTITLVIVDALEKILKTDARGILHLTCSGEASWFDFASEIFDLLGLKRQVVPCTSAEFPRPAPRPKNSRLDNSRGAALGVGPLPHWRQALGDFFTTYPQG